MRSGTLLLAPAGAVVVFALLGAFDRRIEQHVGGALPAHRSVADTFVAPRLPDPHAPALHYSPAEDLEQIDVATLDRAARSVDLAAYVLSDAPVIAALDRAARRGVAVRILVDRGQLEDRPETASLIALQDLADVTLRVKRERVYMHLKAYAVDARILRTGSANFSASGLKDQDNDLVLINDPAAAARFEADFSTMWAKGASE